MEIQDCDTGLRVTHKETGKVATIKNVQIGKGEVDIEFDNGSIARVPPRLLEPASADQGGGFVSNVPMRPCPQCAEKMPVAATVCESCGYQYRVDGPKGMPGIVKALIAIIVLGAIAFVVWKFVL